MIPLETSTTGISSPISVSDLDTTYSTRITRSASDVDLNGIKCKLNDEFGLVIQGILAVVAFSTLILKRLREPRIERRPVRIWFYDTSKQAVGALLMHFSNILLSNLFKGDPCTWYFINFLLDSTIGLIIIYICLQLAQVVIRINGWDSLTFGEYGSPPQCNAWMGQCALYLLVVIFEKVTISMLFLLKFWDSVRNFILKPLRGHPKVELAIVMLVVPFLFNAFMFWVVDNFLMRKTRKAKVLQCDEDKVKVKYRRHCDVTAGSEEEAVLLDSVVDEEAVHQDELVHRDVRR